MPEAATDDYIERIIANKKEWIESQLKHFNENYQKPKEKEMVSGESFKYLGKNYRLKIIESNEEYVRLYRGYIEAILKSMLRIKIILLKSKSYLKSGIKKKLKRSLQN